MSEVVRKVYEMSLNNDRFKKLYHNLNLAEIAYPEYDNVLHDNSSRLLHLAESLDILRSLKSELSPEDYKEIDNTIRELQGINKKKFKPYYWVLANGEHFNISVRKRINAAIKVATIMLVSKRYSLLRERVVEENCSIVLDHTPENELEAELQKLLDEILVYHVSEYNDAERKYMPHKTITDILTGASKGRYGKTDSAEIISLYSEYMIGKQTDADAYCSRMLERYKDVVTDRHKSREVTVEFAEACYDMALLGNDYDKWLIGCINRTNTTFDDPYEFYTTFKDDPRTKELFSKDGNAELLKKFSTSATVPYRDLISCISIVESDKLSTGEVNGYKYRREISEMVVLFAKHNIIVKDDFISEAIKERFNFIRASDNILESVFRGCRPSQALQQLDKSRAPEVIMDIYNKMVFMDMNYTRTQYVEINALLEKVGTYLRTRKLNKTSYLILTGCDRVLREVRERA